MDALALLASTDDSMTSVLVPCSARATRSGGTEVVHVSAPLARLLRGTAKAGSGGSSALWCRVSARLLALGGVAAHGALTLRFNRRTFLEELFGGARSPPPVALWHLHSHGVVPFAEAIRALLQGGSGAVPTRSAGEEHQAAPARASRAASRGDLDGAPPSRYSERRLHEMVWSLRALLTPASPAGATSTARGGGGTSSGIATEQERVFDAIVRVLLDWQNRQQQRFGSAGGDGAADGNGDTGTSAAGHASCEAGDERSWLQQVSEAVLLSLCAQVPLVLPGSGWDRRDGRDERMCYDGGDVSMGAGNADATDAVGCRDGTEGGAAGRTREIVQACAMRTLRVALQGHGGTIVADGVSDEGDRASTNTDAARYGTGTDHKGVAGLGHVAALPPFVEMLVERWLWHRNGTGTSASTDTGSGRACVASGMSCWRAAVKPVRWGETLRGVTAEAAPPTAGDGGEVEAGGASTCTSAVLHRLVGVLLGRARRRSAAGGADGADGHAGGLGALRHLVTRVCVHARTAAAGTVAARRGAGSGAVPSEGCDLDWEAAHRLVSAACASVSAQAAAASSDTTRDDGEEGTVSASASAFFARERRKLCAQEHVLTAACTLLAEGCGAASAGSSTRAGSASCGTDAGAGAGVGASPALVRHALLLARCAAGADEDELGRARVLARLRAAVDAKKAAAAACIQAEEEQGFFSPKPAEHKLSSGRRQDSSHTLGAAKRGVFKVNSRRRNGGSGGGGSGGGSGSASGGTGSGGRMHAFFNKRSSGAKRVTATVRGRGGSGGSAAVHPAPDSTGNERPSSLEAYACWLRLMLGGEAGATAANGTDGDCHGAGAVATAAACAAACTVFTGTGAAEKRAAAPAQGPDVMSGGDAATHSTQLCSVRLLLLPLLRALTAQVPHEGHAALMVHLAEARKVRSRSRHSDTVGEFVNLVRVRILELDAAAEHAAKSGGTQSLVTAPLSLHQDAAASTTTTCWAVLLRSGLLGGGRRTAPANSAATEGAGAAACRQALAGATRAMKRDARLFAAAGDPPCSMRQLLHTRVPAIAAILRACADADAAMDVDTETRALWDATLGAVQHAVLAEVPPERHDQSSDSVEGAAALSPWASVAGAVVGAVGRLLASMHAKGMWESTLEEGGVVGNVDLDNGACRRSRGVSAGHCIASFLRAVLHPKRCSSHEQGCLSRARARAQALVEDHIGSSMREALWSLLEDRLLRAGAEGREAKASAGNNNLVALTTVAAFWPVVVGGGGAAAAHRVGWLIDEAVHGALADAGGMSRAAFLAQSYVSVILAHFAAAQVWYRGGLPCASTLGACAAPPPPAVAKSPTSGASMAKSSGKSDRKKLKLSARARGSKSHSPATNGNAKPGAVPSETDGCSRYLQPPAHDAVLPVLPLSLLHMLAWLRARDTHDGSHHTSPTICASPLIEAAAALVLEAAGTGASANETGQECDRIFTVVPGLATHVGVKPGQVQFGHSVPGQAQIGVSGLCLASWIRCEAVSACGSDGAHHRFCDALCAAFSSVVRRGSCSSATATAHVSVDAMAACRACSPSVFMLQKWLAQRLPAHDDAHTSDTTAAVRAVMDRCTALLNERACVLHSGVGSEWADSAPSHAWLNIVVAAALLAVPWSRVHAMEEPGHAHIARMLDSFCDARAALACRGADPRSAETLPPRLLAGMVVTSSGHSGANVWLHHPTLLLCAARDIVLQWQAYTDAAHNLVQHAHSAEHYGSGIQRRMTFFDWAPRLQRVHAAIKGMCAADGDGGPASGNDTDAVRSLQDALRGIMRSSADVGAMSQPHAPWGCETWTTASVHAFVQAVAQVDGAASLLSSTVLRRWQLLVAALSRSEHSSERRVALELMRCVLGLWTRHLVYGPSAVASASRRSLWLEVICGKAVAHCPGALTALHEGADAGESGATAVAVQVVLLARSWTTHDVRQICAAEGSVVLNVGMRSWLALTNAAGQGVWSAMAASRGVQDAALALLLRTTRAADEQVLRDFCCAAGACVISQLPPAARRAIARRRLGGGAAAPDSSVTAHRNERRRRSIGNSVEREGKRAKTVLPLRSISVDDNVARHSQCEL